jgi:hypothetical protein
VLLHEATKATMAKTPNWTMTSTIRSAATLLAIGLGVGLALYCEVAIALPSYALKENKTCTYCHINPWGGADRNAIGRQYEMNGHSFKKRPQENGTTNAPYPAVK